MNSDNYWAGVDSIDSKSSILEQSGSIDPSFNQQSRHDDGSPGPAYGGSQQQQQHHQDAVAAAVAMSQQHHHHHHMHSQSLESSHGGPGGDGSDGNDLGVHPDGSGGSGQLSSPSHLDMSVTSNSPPGSSPRSAAAVVAAARQARGTNSPPPSSAAGSQVGGAGSQSQQGQSPQDSPQMHHGRLLSNTKRAHQNRQAQRAFRQRKEMYIKELEAKVQELKTSKETIGALRQENIQLRDYILALQSRLIEHPGGVPTPPAVCARQQPDIYEQNKLEK
ncbi:uncharacterized protein SAPINGB_P001660 [Magnusiomyces paraingens]|uniref:Putative transcription factor kapC n=1 Tax=Magnusiomyces paraingens TaxID=2606893 RepID=A0A5E8B8Z7_9ASCO|nr:uncharacterized protein SAPINGB_P001660 [Saprochaete ingens]VVT47335.1 unnamed protein product [Saprochaete ingens]